MKHYDSIHIQSINRTKQKKAWSSLARQNRNIKNYLRHVEKFKEVVDTSV
jgi:hypothetical protein